MCIGRKCNSPANESPELRVAVIAGIVKYHQLLLLLHPFNGLFSRTTLVSRYQKGKTSLDLNEAKDDGVLDAVAAAGPQANNLLLAPDR